MNMVLKCMKNRVTIKCPCNVAISAKILTYCVGANVYIHGKYVGMSLLDGVLRPYPSDMSAVLAGNLGQFYVKNVYCDMVGSPVVS